MTRPKAGEEPCACGHPDCLECHASPLRPLRRSESIAHDLREVAAELRNIRSRL